MEFNDFINDSGLVDIQLSGGDFTWFGHGIETNFLE